MTAVTIPDLNNAKIDLDHLQALLTSPSLTATDRLGNVKMTWSGLLADLNAAAAITTTGANRTAAAASASAAAVSASSAQTAADSALAATKIYATTAAGLAAVASGQYFYVPSPTAGESLVLYLNSAGTAGEIKRYPDARNVYSQQDKIGGALTYTPATVIGSAIAGTAAPTGNIWNNASALPAGELQSVDVYIQTVGDGTGKLVVSRPGTPYTVIYAIAVTGIVGTGVRTVTIPAGYRVAAGDIVGWHAATGGAQVAYNAGGSNPYFITASVNAGATYTPSTTALTFSLAVTVGIMFEVVEDRLDALTGVVAATHRVSNTNGVTTADTSDLDGTFAWANTDGMSADGFVTSVGIRVSSARTGALAFIGPDTNGDTKVLASYAASLASGLNTLTLGSTAARAAVPTMPAVLWMPSGTRVAWVPTSRTTGQGARTTAGGTNPLIYFTGTMTVGQSVTYTDSGAFGDMSLAISYATKGTEVANVFDSIDAASASIASNVVTVTALLNREGVVSTVKTAVTLTFAAGSDIRYDVIYFDQVAKTIGTQVGTAGRTTDPSEFIPALSDPKRIALFNARVTSAAVTVVPVWRAFNGEWKPLENELERERKRGRLYLQKTIGKLRRGAAVKVLSFGDSIVALQNGTPSSATPDGLERDRTTYLSSTGADVVAAIPLYTGLALGRAADAGGAIHMKVGFVWELVAAMEKSGSTVTYNNFGVGGTQTSNAWSAGAATAWLTAAIALAPDVVILNFGMNERGITTTEANMASIIGAFTAAAIEVIVMGCARINNMSAVSDFNDWRYTNRALRRSAVYGNAAFLPMLPLYETDYLGVVGCTAVDTCAANRNNHPGIREHVVIGKELTKLVMGAA